MTTNRGRYSGSAKVRKFVEGSRLVLVSVVVCAFLGTAGGFARIPRHSGQGNQARCDALQRFLMDTKNFTRDVVVHDRMTDSHNTICGGRCCDKEMEDHLRERAKEDFHKQIHHHSRSLLGLLATTADTLRETVTTLARQSENKTLTLFTQVYRTMSAQSKPSIASLYQAMVDYVSPANTNENIMHQLHFSKEMLHQRFDDFFRRLFPIAYHRAVNPMQGQQDFTDKFKNCLYQTMDEIQPFGDIPKQIASSLSKSLEATRVLVQALTLGKSVLGKTDGLLFSSAGTHQEACYRALFRMSHCPRCRGVEWNVMPCKGFCINVMRGCLTKPAQELDFAWSEYIETVERLVVAVNGHSDPLALNVEKAVRHLDSRISDAVMHAMEKGPALEEKVRKVCGRPELEPSSISVGPAPVLPASIAASSARSSAAFLGLVSTSGGGPVLHPPTITSTPKAPSQLHIQLGNFLASVDRSRTFYGNLADNICGDYTDMSCWNGERIGEYVKTVADPTLNSQKYNPEFTSSVTNTNTAEDSYVSANSSVLIDQLRHIKQVVQSQMMTAPDTLALLADETLDGSGSGDRPVWRGPGEISGIATVDNDDEDGRRDQEEDEGSGSGHGPTFTDRITPDNINSNSNKVDSKGAGSTISLMPVTALLLLIVSQFVVLV